MYVCVRESFYVDGHWINGFEDGYFIRFDQSEVNSQVKKRSQLTVRDLIKENVTISVEPGYQLREGRNLRGIRKKSFF